MGAVPDIQVLDGYIKLAAPTGKDMVLEVDSGRAIRFSSVFKLAAANGANAANALLMGVGTTADPALTSVAGKNFVEMRTKSTATSGDSRNHYLRHDIGGAGGSGECLRVITDLTAAANTARGAQISVQAGATGYVTGLAVGVDAQLYLKNEVLAANGTYAAVNAEIYAEGSTTNPAGATQMSFIRCNIGGPSSTSTDRVDDKAYLLTLDGVAEGAGNLVVASTTEANYAHAARCWIKGIGDVWLMFASASG